VVVFGLPELLRAQDDKRPEWLEAALKRMKETRRMGLVFVAPAEEARRRALGERLWQLAESKDPAARALAGECVMLCVTREVAKPLWGDVDVNENALVLDADGKRLGAGTLVFAKVVDEARSLLNGAAGARLKAASAAALEALAVADREAVVKALDEVDVEGEPPAAPVGLLRSRADRIAPSLALTSLAAVYAPGREACRALLVEMGDRLSAKDEPRLPFGARVGEEKVMPEGEGCGPCGMAVARPVSRKFLEFLTR
jgi:hypothetical protein